MISLSLFVCANLKERSAFRPYELTCYTTFTITILFLFYTGVMHHTINLSIL